MVEPAILKEGVVKNTDEIQEEGVVKNTDEIQEEGVVKNTDEIQEEEVVNNGATGEQQAEGQNRPQIEQDIEKEEVVNNGATGEQQADVPGQNRPQMGETVHVPALNDIQFQGAEGEGDFMAEFQDSEVKMWLHNKRCKADKRIEDVNIRADHRTKKVNDAMTDIVAQLDRCKEAYLEGGRQNRCRQIIVSSIEAKRGRFIARMTRKIDIIRKEAEKSRLKIESKFKHRILEAESKEARKDFMKKQADIRIKRRVQLQIDRTQGATVSGEIKAINVPKKVKNACGVWCCGDVYWLKFI